MNKLQNIEETILECPEDDCDFKMPARRLRNHLQYFHKLGPAGAEKRVDNLLIKQRKVGRK